jgi:SAM-dependent methyltransferase
MSSPPDAAGRLAREREHHREIAPRAEVVWNWASPSGRCRAARRAGFYLEAIAAFGARRALELGCGSGVFLERIVTSQAAVVALDLSTDLLTQARDKLRARARSAAFCCGNAEQLPFPDGAFDAVYGSSILHHLDLRVALAELYRVLRPGGRLVFAEPNLLNPQIALSFHVLPRRWNGFSDDEMAFTRFAVVRLLREAGFADATSEPYDFLHPIVPGPLVGLVARLSLWLEHVPLVREIAGSQIIRARRP